MLTEELQIYRDTYRLAGLLLSWTNNMNRCVRYSVHADCVSMTLAACDLIYRANSDRDSRTIHLQRYLELIGGVRTRVRLLHEQRYIDVRKATNAQYIIDKVAKQATGWRNSSAHQ